MNGTGCWSAIGWAGLAIAAITANSPPFGGDQSLLLATSLPPQVEIVVDNTSDVVNGVVSTVAGLLANPGPDGVSLREAIEATNADSGSYKVVFDASLAGSTIETWGFELLGGNVHLDGDIDGDIAPDVTLAASGLHVFLTMSSSGNTVAYLGFDGIGVSIQTEVPGVSFDGNSVIGNTFRNVPQAVVSHPAGPLVLTEWNNSWTNTLIKDNDIEATRGGINLMFHFSIGNSFDGLEIIGNHIQIAQPVGNAAGISLSAGFWDGSTSNSFRNVVIANNVIQGRPNNPIHLMTGAVGSSGNVIDGVQIVDNQIDTIARQSLAEQGTVSAIMLISADATTTHFDPDYEPVVAPHDNAIRNVEIARNTVSGFGGAGVILSAGWTGLRNAITDIGIHDNVIDGFLPNWGRSFAGIHVVGGEGQPDATAAGNSIRRVSVTDNHIVITGNPDVADPPYTLSSGGILIEGAESGVDQEVIDITVEGNLIDAPVPGVNIIGGVGWVELASRNTVSSVDVFCNQVEKPPLHLLDHYPGMAGINIVGGAGAGSLANSAHDVRVSRNIVASVWNDVSSFNDLDYSTGGQVDWVVDDALATDCALVPGNTAPQAVDSTWNVAENAAVGSLVGVVSASDPDSDDLSYAIADGNTGAAFSINNQTGAVTVAVRLDFETTSSYALSVTVSDGALSNTATMTVNVTDVDETSVDFVDDDGSVFEADIEWMAATGITRGCNPPANDMFCPDDFVTRGQMAAFLVRALGYTDDGGGNLFVDDDASVFEGDIDRLGTAGVTKGCNPPTNDRYCPDDFVTRGQMAAFLVRALGYTDNGGGDLFTDDDSSVFESDIDRLGTAGVTKGCNPPTNDEFCPNDFVTRGQMAAFLHRALG